MTILTYSVSMSLNGTLVNGKLSEEETEKLKNHLIDNGGLNMAFGVAAFPSKSKDAQEETIRQYRDIDSFMKQQAYALKHAGIEIKIPSVGPSVKSSVFNMVNIESGKGYSRYLSLEKQERVLVPVHATIRNKK